MPDIDRAHRTAHCCAEDAGGGGQIVGAVPDLCRLIGTRRPCQSRVFPETGLRLQQEARSREIRERVDRVLLAAESGGRTSIRRSVEKGTARITRLP